MGRYVFTQKSGPPPTSNTWYMGPTWVIIPNGISIGSAGFVWVLNDMLCNALSMGKKTPKIAPSSRDFVTPPAMDRATAVGNVHKILVKVARVVREMIVDRYTQTCSLQFFANAPTGKPAESLLYQGRRHHDFAISVIILICINICYLRTALKTWEKVLQSSSCTSVKRHYNTIRYGRLTCAQKLTGWPAKSSARPRNEKIIKKK